MNGTQGATLTAHPGLRARYPWLRYPWLVAALLLALLIFITVNVIANGPLTSLDHSIGHAIQSVADRRALRWVRHGQTTPARLIIDLAAIEVAVPFLALAAVAAAIRERRVRPLIAGAVGAVTTLACIYAGKELIHQLAPRQVFLGHTGGSFPSGHMTTGCVCYFLIVVLLFPAGSRGRRVAMIAATVLCALIGASLLWCDLHWFSDVAGGAVLSALLVMLAAWVNRPTAGGWPAGPPVRPEASALDQAGR